MILSISCKLINVLNDDEKRIDVHCFDVQNSEEQMEHIVDFLWETYGDKALDYFNRIYKKD